MEGSWVTLCDNLHQTLKKRTNVLLRVHVKLRRFIYMHLAFLFILTIASQQDACELALEKAARLVNRHCPSDVSDDVEHMWRRHEEREAVYPKPFGSKDG